MKRPRLFAEIPAGLASVSLVLQGGRHCKPPVSRMGNKHGYALPILDAMGLRPGLGAESYLWTEADPDVRALLCAYTQPDLLRAVAEVLRGWASEEPRALWTRLRDERRARVAALPPAEHVAEWTFLHHGSYCYKGIDAGIGRPEGNPGEEGFGVVRPSREIVHDAAVRLSRGPGWPPVAVTATAPSAEEVAGWLAFVSGSHPGGGAPRGVCSNRGETCDGHHPSRVAQASSLGELAALPWPPTLVTAQAPSAEQVAEWVISANWSYEQGNVRTGFVGPGDRRQDTSAVAVAVAVGRLAEVSSRPAGPTRGADLEGCVIYQDWPYRNTTPYAHDLARAEQVRLALEYAAAGALVVLSEATPYEELTALGWEAVNIGGERRGQKRTFGATEEWLTMSSPPVNRPRIQVGLFG